MSLVLQDNLSVQVAKWVAEKIITSEFLPGSRIMEAKIADELKISRGPIREALLILQKQRLIDILPRRGAVVKEIAPDEIKALYDVLGALYTLLGQNVARNWQGNQLAPFAVLLKSMNNLAKQGDYINYFQQMIEFIRASYPIANNKLLQGLIEDIIPSVYRVQYLSIMQRKGNLKEHWKNYALILQAVEARDIAKVAAAIAQFSEQEQKVAMSLEACDAVV